MQRCGSIAVAGFVLLLVGCAAVPGAEQPCTELGAPTGVGLTIEAPLAAAVADAAMQVCWGGDCHSPEVVLQDSTTAGDTECTGDGPDDSCSAVQVPNGEKTGFASLPELPTQSVRVAVTLVDKAGATVFDHEVNVTPAQVYPNGPSCGAQGVQAAVVATATELKQAQP